MHNFIEYFADWTPGGVVISLMAVYGIMQGIGEFLEFKGKIVPEFMKIRKKFIRQRKEKETLHEMTELMPSLKKVPEALERTTALLESVDNHYSHDNITMRDDWMKGVNNNIDEIHRWMQSMSDKIDKNNEDTLAIRIENMRTDIIDFASYVSDDTKPVTKEQFRRIFRMYKDYEKILADNNRTNGEVDIAIHIIQTSYEKHLCTHSFVEDFMGV